MPKRDRPTMIDVAADAGVSLKTVSRVINGVATVDAVLVEKVTASIEKLGFRRNVMAANLRSGASDTIGLVTADLANSFYTSLAAAVSAVAVRQGYQVIMASTDEDPAAERALALDLCQRRVSGLILVPSGHDQGYLQHEIRMGTPVVFLDRPAVGATGDAVLIDNRGGAERAVRELVAEGHRRIALLFDSLAIFTMSERLEGVKAALTDAGHEIDPRLLATDLHTPELARSALEALLAAPDPPTAVFCANNRATIGAVEALVAAGSQIPVAGFDDFEASRLLPFRVRLVDYDTPRLGIAAAERLFARIGGDTTDPGVIVQPTHLVDRGGPVR
ncbi:LacI family DNA-binding transcriptional regulator [Microbacterium sp. SSM24]|uniref:LacI family DNA-binding transcriptional regulator n=1 Tax=Microbacterium sp. SSM24 TaxID=2991714 RepID=UPI0022260F58|nr:LacI family DNA-binding transcriptional regulator [Microbacterium sp. SSM24]MCW3493372.1 LacI family transcriptional regulator [Microbacterium sp. SSM24]